MSRVKQFARLLAQHSVPPWYDTVPISNADWLGSLQRPVRIKEGERPEKG